MVVEGVDEADEPVVVAGCLKSAFRLFHDIVNIKTWRCPIVFAHHTHLQSSSHALPYHKIHHHLTTTPPPSHHNSTTTSPQPHHPFTTTPPPPHHNPTTTSPQLHLLALPRWDSESCGTSLRRTILKFLLSSR